jgi:lipoprotein NlpD
MKGKPIFYSHQTHLKNLACVSLLGLLITACSSNPPAPVVNRLPSQASTPTSPQKVTPSSRQAYKPGDWRPDTYVVKPGDTLFSIGLAFGYDYKEIASANRINAPYVIRVGQTLQLASLKAADAQPNAGNTDGDVTTFALSDNTETTAVSKPTPPKVAAITEPLAIREPYSDTAFNTALPVAKSSGISAVEAPAATSTPATASQTAEPVNQTDAKNATWIWPTKGKVLSVFNQAGNKGIDIGGTRGQAINAASAGKVIYSGSDLRGYGKLVIIKHNATFLSVYAHNSVIMVKEGQQVSQGQKIAEMGDSDSPNVKLHFEIRKQGQSVDPAPYLGVN